MTGRTGEVARLRDLVVGVVAAGRGASVWVEGEAGIGKSSVLAAGLAGAGEAGAGVFRGVCDELGQRLPLRVLTGALGVEESTADPELAAIAGLLNGHAGVLAVDSVALAVPRLVDWVGRVAVTRPVVLVLDDAQWADAASLLVVAELARLVGQLPVLLAVAARPVPRRAEVSAARRAVLGRGGSLVRLGPLPPPEVAEMVRRLVGARPGPALREAAAAAGGNPLYVRELVDALVRDERTSFQDGVAELASASSAPVSLAGAISDRLGFLSEDAVDVLRLAAVLGSEFSVPDLATVAGRSPSALVGVVQEALAAGVLAEAGQGLRFRHGLIRQELAESMPAGLRSALHVQVARTLLESGAGVERVAEQLLATGDHDILAEQWVLSWLVDAGSRLVNRAPDSAAELLRAALEQLPADEPRAEELSGHLLNALWLNRRDAEAEQLARQILPQGRDPERIGAAAWRMVSSINRGGRYQESLEAGEKALADGVVTGRWSTRLRTLQALSLFMLGEHEQSMAICEAALAEAEQAADGFAAGWALHVLSFNRMNDRDHAGAIECCRRALDALGTDLEGSDLRMLVMSNHAAALNDADRLAEAREAFSEAIRLAEHAAPARLAMSRVQAAAQLFECGAWDDVLAELKDLQLGSSVMQDVVPQILRARIALHRDDMAAAGPALRAVEAAHRGSPWSAQAMMDAHAETAEHAGEPRKLLVALAPLFDPTQASYVVQSQWLPAAVRAALAVGDAATARTAERAAADEAARSGTPTVRAIAEHSRGLLAGDGAVLRAAAEMFAEVGRPLPAAQAFEDAAVAFAEAGDAVAARTAVAAALARYAALGATHDTRRTKARLRAHGLRLVQQEPARRPATGWEALTPAEVQVVDLLRVGRSNPDIAAELFLSRRTVESHVSRILTKLGAKSRLEVIAAARPAAPSG